MNLSLILSDTCNSSERLIADVDNLILAKIYCSKCEVYCRYLQHSRDEAEKYYQNFRKQNDMIFDSAMEILNLAIDNGNVELADVALKTIQTMKKTYPDFYRAYNIQLFGKGEFENG